MRLHVYLGNLPDTELRDPCYRPATVEEVRAALYELTRCKTCDGSGYLTPPTYCCEGNGEAAERQCGCMGRPTEPPDCPECSPPIPF